MDEDRQNKISQFCVITNASELWAADVLESHNWDVNNAVNYFMENAFAPSARAGSEPSDAVMDAAMQSPPAALTASEMPARPPQSDFMQAAAEDEEEDLVASDPSFGGEVDENASIEQQLLEAAIAASMRAEGLSAPDLDLGVQGQAVPRSLASDRQPFPEPAAASAIDMDAEQAELLRLQHEEWESQFNEEAAAEREASRANWTSEPVSPGVMAARSIREEQDFAYMQSLEADRIKAEKEAERRAEEEAYEAQRQRAMTEAQRAQEEAAATLFRTLAAKAAALPPEPPADEPGIVQVRVRLPDGSQHNRRFLRTHSLKALFDSIDTEGKAPVGSYRLVSSYPRQVFTESAAGVSFEEVGLSSKQEALLLEPL